MAKTEAEGAPQERVPLTDGEVAELRRLDANAIPPPWEARACSVVTSRVGFDIDKLPRPEEADLIAAARNALPRLLREVERLRERESRTERAALEVHGMSECRYMEPLWGNYTGLPCHECIEAARRMAIKADGLEDLT